MLPYTVLHGNKLSYTGITWEMITHDRICTYIHTWSCMTSSIFVKLCYLLALHYKMSHAKFQIAKLKSYLLSKQL